MTYSQTTEWMFNQLPMYQQIGASAYKKDLNNTLLLAKHLGNPETKFKSIHVGGTNGKGSTSSMLASIFIEAGYKVGLYTSPHLKDFRERITINGKKISKNYIIQFIEKNKVFLQTNQLSFFEMTVGLAFEYFANKKVDIAIIEVGMGGRLDSTNIINPIASVITNIGMDHMQFLGNSLTSIATEKAGIIKKEIPVIIGEATLETKKVFLDYAEKNNSKIYFAEDNIIPNYPSQLAGDYQIANKKTVATTFEIIKEQFKLNTNHLLLGIQNVISNTHLQGRWQIIQQQPKIITDTAHNNHGLRIVLNQLKNEKYLNLRIILGVVNDKDLETILPLFPKDATYYFCKPKVQRGLAAEQLQQEAKKFSLFGKTYKSVKSALNKAKKDALPSDIIYAGGSTFVVAEII